MEYLRLVCTDYFAEGFSEISVASDSNAGIIQKLQGAYEKLNESVIDFLSANVKRERYF
jgi:hypothetical protein